MKNLFSLSAKRQKKLYKFFSIFASLALVFQSFLPYVPALVSLSSPTVAVAEEQDVVEPVVVEEEISSEAESGEESSEEGVQDQAEGEPLDESSDQNEEPASQPGEEKGSGELNPVLAVEVTQQEPGVPVEDPVGSEIDLDLSEPEIVEASAQLNPEVSTDKDDYAPGETVAITGSNFSPNTLLVVKVTRPDDSVVLGDGSFDPGSDEVLTNGEGKLTYLYQLNGIIGEYFVEVLDLSGAVLATTVFTDGPVNELELGNMCNWCGSCECGDPSPTPTPTPSVCEQSEWTCEECQMLLEIGDPCREVFVEFCGANFGCELEQSCFCARDWVCEDTCEDPCVEGEVFMIGDEEVGQMDNPVDELNWPGGFGVFPSFPDPFIVGTHADNQFPWNSNYNKSYATDFDLEFNYPRDDAVQAKLTIGWSPGKSANEQKEVLLDGTSLGKTPNRLGVPVSGWWEQMERFEDSFTFALSKGDHKFTFKHPMGDGTLWDYVKLEIISCEEKPTPTPTSQVTVCKYDPQDTPLPGWKMILKASHVETVNVYPSDSLGSTGGVTNYVASSTSLSQGDYVLEANGYYTYRPSTLGAEYTDAVYSKRHPNDSIYGGPYAPWVNVTTFPSPHTGWLGVMVDGSSNWSNYYNSNHKYAMGLPGYMGPITFTILDSYYGDNSGFIPVDIYEGYAGLTGEDGCVTFEDVPYGDYTLEEILMDGWEYIGGNQGLVLVDSQEEDFYLKNNEIIQTGSISGYKWEDKNTNGVVDYGEDYLEGWTINLWNGAGVMNPPLPADDSTTTLFDGTYRFDNLPYGDYTVCEEMQPGWAQHVPGGDSCYYVTVGTGKEVDDQHFGNYQLGEITVCKYDDLDGDGILDRNEPGLTGVTMTLEKQVKLDDPCDEICHGQCSCGGWSWKLVKEDITERDGCVEFDVLTEGTYRVAENVPEGYYPTTSVTTDPFDLSSGESKKLIFLNTRYGKISGYKFGDYNVNWVWNEGEPGLSGWEICLDEIRGEELIEQVLPAVQPGEIILEPAKNCVFTDENGYYEFTGLKVGGYSLTETPKEGWTQTVGPDNVTILSGTDSEDNNFGNFVEGAKLVITKTNEEKNNGTTVDVGSIVHYILTVTNTGFSKLYGVVVEDAQPVTDYFEYKKDSGHLTCTDGTDIDLTASGDNPYFWSIGDLDPEEDCTLTYEMEITGNIPGEHYNIAHAYGSSCNQLLSFVALAPSIGGPRCSMVYSNYAVDPFDLTYRKDLSAGVGGQVLGASTGDVLGAATGSETKWLLLAISMIISGLGLILFSRRRKIIKLSTMFLLGASMFLTSAPAVLAADSTAPVVEIIRLPEYMSKKDFEVSYTALDSGGSGLKDVKLELHKDGQGWQDLAVFTDVAAKTNVGSKVDSEGKWFFKATACDKVSNCSTSETSTTVDLSGPPKPENFSKEKTSPQSYRLKWRNPESDDLRQVYIYRSDKRDFTADNGTEVARIDVSEKTDSEWNDAVVPDSSKDYYYVIRSVDQAGNGSELVGDLNITVVESVDGEAVSGDEAVVGQELGVQEGVSDGSAGGGQILGEEATEATDGAKVGSESADMVGEEGESKDTKSQPWLLILGGITLAGAAYWFFIKK